MLNLNDLDLQDLIESDTQDETPEPIPDPTISVEETDDRYGKFVAGPLRKGYGTTLGNPLRRALYNSLPGTAVTWVKIEGALHEYGTVPNIKEEVLEILLNVKDIRIRSATDAPGKIRLDVAGIGKVCAGDIMATSDYEIVNPELHIATMDSDEAKLSIELNVESGVGYQQASDASGLPIGVLPVDAVFTPIRKVNYKIDNVRVGQYTDFEQLTFEIWTDGSITPLDALQKAGNILVGHFFLFSNAEQASQSEEGEVPVALQISPEHYSVVIERLELSSRTLNCLKRASIDTIGQVLENKPQDLLKIRNFGEKSMNELYDQMRMSDLLPAHLDPNLQDDVDDGEEGEIDLDKSVSLDSGDNSAGEDN